MNGAGAGSMVSGTIVSGITNMECILMALIVVIVAIGYLAYGRFADNIGYMSQDHQSEIKGLVAEVNKKDERIRQLVDENKKTLDALIEKHTREIADLTKEHNVAYQGLAEGKIQLRTNEAIDKLDRDVRSLIQVQSAEMKSSFNMNKDALTKQRQIVESLDNLVTTMSAIVSQMNLTCGIKNGKSTLAQVDIVAATKKKCSVKESNAMHQCDVNFEDAMRDDGVIMFEG